MPMTSLLKLIRRAMFISGIILSTYLLAETSDTTKREKDSNGIYTSPICDYDFRIIRSLKTFLNEIPTSFKASSEEWEMQIYANDDETWTLIGKSKVKTTSSIKRLCHLDRGNKSTYLETPWFKQFFRSPPN